jgi:hypothetical protein
VTGTETTETAGSGTVAANPGDIDYSGSAGTGGTTGVAGLAGLAILVY